MNGTFAPVLVDLPGPGPLGRVAVTRSLEEHAGHKETETERAACFHCGEPCRNETFAKAEKAFCCQGCLVVHDLLAENGLDQFYDLSRHPEVRIKSPPKQQDWSYLDDPVLQERLLHFTDGKSSRVSFDIPSIHCIACVWLLENLFRLRAGIGSSQVDFARRRVTISFATKKISLSQLVSLLASIGFEPKLTLGELDKPKATPGTKRLWLQIGIAGFAFGNIMLFSIPTYLGLDSLSGGMFKALFGWLSLALAAPVLIYSASDYWRAARLAFRRRALTLDVPIALGLAALYAQSAYEIFSGSGEGYLDSLVGLVFFLLCGRAFQQKTHERIAFDLDYKCFFPLSVRRKCAAGEETVALSELKVSDRLLVLNGELIPADARLLDGPALIDYSFVTGEAEPVTRRAGDYLYAGGKQIGAGIELEIMKPVSQSYLTSLWNHETFQKDRERNLQTLTNQYSRRFTWIVLAVAVGAMLFWIFAGNVPRALKAFTSVLIVACPCALALAAPFTLGTAQRLLARMQVFLRNALVLERMAQVNAIVFDKTGTLTTPQRECRMENARSGRREAQSGKGEAVCQLEEPKSRPGSDVNLGNPDNGLCGIESSRVAAVARHSIHPHSVAVCNSLNRTVSTEPVTSFIEMPGCGIEGTVQGHTVRLGSGAWLESHGITVPDSEPHLGSVSYLAIDGILRATFSFSNCLRPEIERALAELKQDYDLALLSGDNERERHRFAVSFGPQASLHFNQSPLDKLGFIQQLQHSGKIVLMAGDGLNDSGALKQSDVGVAVVERIGAFSPSSDVILEAGQISRLPRILGLARSTARIVRLSFAVSAIYNLAGVSIAAAGVLSPLICAVLMPLSSISVVLFACGATHWAARRAGLFLLPNPIIPNLHSALRAPHSATL